MIERIKTFLECFLVWKIEPSKNLEKADVFIAQSFGLRKDSPGLTNKKLAKEIRKLHKVYSCPLILQWEIADCLPDLKDWIALRIEKHRVLGKYLDSKEVKTQAAIEMEKRGWRTAILISHPCHNWRCKRILERLGIRVLTPLLKDIPFDFKSEQWWTRTNVLWIIKEIPIRVGSFIKGWI